MGGLDMPAVLFDLIQAPLRWQVVKAGLELGLFDALATPLGPDEVSDRLTLDRRRCGLLLRSLAAMKLIEAERGRYRIAPAAEAYLLADGDRSMRELLLSMSRVRHGDVAELVRNGDAGPPLNMADAAFWDRSADSLRSFHRAMGTEAVLAVLRDLPQWNGLRSVLDVGAGSGQLARRLVSERPDMRVTVLDLEPMAARISASLAGVEGADRVQVHAGDFNQGIPPGPHDLIWAAMTLYYARDLVAVLRDMRAALAPGGVFVSFHEGLDETRSRPETHVVGRLVPALRGQDSSFVAGQIAAALLQAGFVQVESREVDTAFGLMRVDVGVRD